MYDFGVVYDGQTLVIMLWPRTPSCLMLFGSSRYDVHIGLGLSGLSPGCRGAFVIESDFL